MCLALPGAQAPSHVVGTEGWLVVEFAKETFRERLADSRKLTESCTDELPGDERISEALLRERHGPQLARHLTFAFAAAVSMKCGRAGTPPPPQTKARPPPPHRCPRPQP